jgi:hypothetical protein
MKKFNLVAIATIAIAIVSSCSNEDSMLVSDNTNTQQAGTIGFSNAFVNKSTRATAVTDNNTLDNFYVWGYAENDEVFYNEKVSKAGDDWTYQTIKYWVPNKAYTFTAIAASEGAGSWNYNPTSNIGGTITIDNKGEQDLVYAYQTSAATEKTTRGTVRFTFNHLLSRAKFRFINGTADGEATFKIRNLKITNADQSASLDLAQGSFANWNINSGTTNFAYDDTVSFEPGNSVTTDYKYLIPHAEAHQYQVSFDIDVTQGNSTWTYSHSSVLTESIEMKSGKSYVFAITFNKDNINPDGSAVIQFAAESVIDWDAESNNALGQKSASEDTTGTTTANPFADDDMYFVYNPQWFGSDNNSTKMDKNADGTYSITSDKVIGSFIISSTIENDYFFGIEAGKRTQASLIDGQTAVYDLIQYSYEKDVINWDYQKYQMELNYSASDYKSLKFTFDPNKKTLTVEKI